MADWVLLGNKEVPEEEETPESGWTLLGDQYEEAPAPVSTGGGLGIDTSGIAPETEQWMGETGERTVTTSKGLGLGVPNIGTIKEMGKAALQGVVGDPIRAARGAIEATDPEGVVDVVPGMGVGHMSAVEQAELGQRISEKGLVGDEVKAEIEDFTKEQFKQSSADLKGAAESLPKVDPSKSTGRIHDAMVGFSTFAGSMAMNVASPTYGTMMVASTLIGSKFEELEKIPGLT